MGNHAARWTRCGTTFAPGRPVGICGPPLRCCCSLPYRPLPVAQGSRRRRPLSGRGRMPGHAAGRGRRSPRRQILLLPQRRGSGAGAAVPGVDHGAGDPGAAHHGSHRTRPLHGASRRHRSEPGALHRSIPAITPANSAPAPPGDVRLRVFPAHVDDRAPAAAPAGVVRAMSAAAAAGYAGVPLRETRSGGVLPAGRPCATCSLPSRPGQGIRRGAIHTIRVCWRCAISSVIRTPEEFATRPALGLGALEQFVPAGASVGEVPAQQGIDLHGGRIVRQRLCGCRAHRQRSRGADARSTGAVSAGCAKIVSPAPI